MSEQDVGDITFGNHLILILCAYFLHQDFIILIGIFQLKRARSYAEEKCSTTNLTGVVQYAIQRCLIIPNLIRIPTQSAHVDRIIRIDGKRRKGKYRKVKMSKKKLENIEKGNVDT